MSAAPIQHEFVAMDEGRATLLHIGHLVLANWQGHGAGFGGSGMRLLEFDRAGEIVCSRSKPDLISSLQGVLVLDGLDTARLHDEREGLMRPIGR